APPPPAEATEAGAAAPRRRLSPRARLAIAVVAIAAVLGGILWWLPSRRYESTDDAQIDGHLNPISARVAGTVTAVAPGVEDNRFVQAGALLVEIDPADYQAQLDQAAADVARLTAAAAASRAEVPVASANATGQLQVAQAMLGQARDAVAAARANREAARARLAQAEANAKRAEDDRARYANLVAKQEISRSEYDRRATEAKTAQEQVTAARAEVASAEQQISAAQGKVAQQQADLLRARSAPEQIQAVQARSGSASADLARAQSQLEIARLNLARTKIVAPVSGVVGRRSVEVGQRVQPGQELLTLIQLDDVWVTANFKETQLANVRPGQPATIHVDTYGRDYSGHVESIAAATGARFSLLPPENATGNFVKVVQRLPVRIRIDKGQDKDHLLRPGMSVDAKIQLR
ncbi:MAG TPA: HlyD family secretion protein, partial [Solirubrobacterales bacterium]|nr:HlyD family secretion protein [Solirubrobacterales bacterium]